MTPVVGAASYPDILARLHVPDNGTLRVLIDTDTYNEVDDQFAVVFAVRSAPRLDVQAIYAAPFHWPGAPFHNSRSSSPEDGMERSYDEAERILKLIGRPDIPVYRGSRAFLGTPARPVASEAAANLVERVMASEEPTYVLALGALTNVASALLIEPRIRERMVLVWLGGNPLYWPEATEFNLSQDIPAVRTVLDSGVSFIQIPCLGVASHLATTIAELDQHIAGRTEIGTYLTDIVREYVPDRFGRSKVIWDISTVAHVLNPSWVQTTLTTSPLISPDARWSRDDRRHPMLTAYWIDRDAVFADLFGKINQSPG